MRLLRCYVLCVGANIWSNKTYPSTTKYGDVNDIDVDKICHHHHTYQSQLHTTRHHMNLPVCIRTVRIEIEFESEADSNIILSICSTEANTITPTGNDIGGEWRTQFVVLRCKVCVATVSLIHVCNSTILPAHVRLYISEIRLLIIIIISLDILLCCWCLRSHRHTHQHHWTLSDGDGSGGSKIKCRQRSNEDDKVSCSCLD